MIKKRGFSLIEVLISLSLVSTLSLILFTQQGQIKQRFLGFSMQAQATQFLDQVDESLLIGLPQLPLISAPYNLVLTKDKQSIQLRLAWSSERNFIIRTHRVLGINS